MERKKEPKTKTITITLPQGQFPVITYVNRCGVENVDGHKLVYFGFANEVDKRESVLSVFACIFERPMLDLQRKSWLEYLRDIGYPAEEKKLDWQPPAERVHGVTVVNAAALSRSGDYAEIRCFNYSMGDVLGKSNEVGEQAIAGQTIALVRCTLDMQRQFLAALFDANELVT